MRVEGRTVHSSSSVHTFTPRLRISAGWKKVSDCLVAATCTDTFLYYTLPAWDKKKVILRNCGCGLANLEELSDYDRRLDRGNATRCDEKNVRVSFAPVFCGDEMLSHTGEVGGGGGEVDLFLLF